jgi:hypothetical protein
MSDYGVKKAVYRFPNDCDNGMGYFIKITKLTKKRFTYSVYIYDDDCETLDEVYIDKGCVGMDKTGGVKENKIKFKNKFYILNDDNLSVLDKHSLTLNSNGDMVNEYNQCIPQSVIELAQQQQAPVVVETIPNALIPTDILYLKLKKIFFELIKKEIDTNMTDEDLVNYGVALKIFITDFKNKLIPY